VTSPVKGETPNTTASGTGNFTLSSVTWDPDHNPFEGGTVYTASVTLTAANGFTFPSDLSATINGNTAAISNNTGNTVTLFFTFAPTFEKDISGISIISQPANLSYTQGNTLDLSGLIVRINFTDQSSEDVALARFADMNISANPAHGQQLNRVTHNGHPVVISLGTHTVSTSNLTVDPFTPNLPIAFKTVSNGGDHTLAIKTDGSLWAWGRNDFGQLGDGTTTNINAPVKIGDDNDWASVSAGDYHSLAIKEDGTLWAWGWNDEGRLGNPQITPPASYSPVQIGTDTNWVYVSAGSEHSLAIKTDGTLWAWGSNIRGQIGNNSTSGNPIDSPFQIMASNNIEPWVSVSGGGLHSLAIKEDGTLWAWGWNQNGQLGDGSVANRFEPVPIGTDTDWASVYAGGSHSLAIKEDGTLWAWGRNDLGQLGLGDNVNQTEPTQVGTDSNWASVSAGQSHSLAIKTNGTLWAWGRNTSGQLGDDTQLHRDAPVGIGTNDWVSVSAGGTRSLAIKIDGTLWAWGYNGGLLGDGTTTQRNAPVQIGGN